MPEVVNEKKFKRHHKLTVIPKKSINRVSRCTVKGELADEIRQVYEKRKNQKNFTENNQASKWLDTSDFTLIKDDRMNNIIVFQSEEEYPGNVRDHITIVPTVSSLVSMFIDPNIFPFRKSPKSIPFPLWVEEEIEVELPFEVESFEDTPIHYTHGALEFFRTSKASGNRVITSFEIKPLKDHVAKDEIRSFIELSEKICRIPTSRTVTPAKKK